MAILEAGGAGLFAVAVYHPHLVHHRGGQVVQRRALVVEKEGAAAYGDFVNFLSVELHLAIVRYLHARHAFKEVLEHSVGAHPEGGGVEFHGVFFDDDGIAHLVNHGSLQVLLVLLQFHRTQLRDPFPKIAAFHKGLEAHHLYVEGVLTKRDLLQLGLSLVVGKGKVGDGGILGRNHIHGSKGDGLVGE